MQDCYYECDKINVSTLSKMGIFPSNFSQISQILDRLGLINVIVTCLTIHKGGLPELS